MINKKLTSPNYPEVYDTNTVCKWNLTTDKGYYISLDFEHIYVSEKDNDFKCLNYQILWDCVIYLVNLAGLQDPAGLHLGSNSTLFWWILNEPKFFMRSVELACIVIFSYKQDFVVLFTFIKPQKYFFNFVYFFLVKSNVFPVKNDHFNPTNPKISVLCNLISHNILLWDPKGLVNHSLNAF